MAFESMEELNTWAAEIEKRISALEKSIAGTADKLKGWFKDKPAEPKPE